MVTKQTTRIVFLVALLWMVYWAEIGAAEPMIDQRPIFVAGHDNVHTYRIPSLITAPDGTLLAFCEARMVSTRDKSPTKMVLKRSSDAGRTWTSLQVLHDVADNAAMDPCSVIDQSTETIWLFFEVWPKGSTSNVPPGLTPPSTTCWMMSSRDNGKTWTEPTNMTTLVKKPDWCGYSFGPGVGIQTTCGPKVGRMIIPCRHAVGRRWTHNHLVISDDQGKTWRIGEGIVPNAGDECQIVELSDGRYQLNIRSGNSQRLITHSTDEGKTWIPVKPDANLIEPRACQASFLRYSFADAGGGRDRILFSNPAHSSSRVNMSVRLSYDQGKTWPVTKTVHAGPSAYSCLTVLNDRTIGLLYEGGQTGPYDSIIFARFNLEWLTEGKDQTAG